MCLSIVFQPEKAGHAAVLQGSARSDRDVWDTHTQSWGCGRAVAGGRLRGYSGVTGSYQIHTHIPDIAPLQLRGDIVGLMAPWGDGPPWSSPLRGLGRFGPKGIHYGPLQGYTSFHWMPD